MTRSLLLLLLVALSAYRVACRAAGPPTNEGPGVTNLQYICNLVRTNPGPHGNPQTTPTPDGGYRLTMTPSMELGPNNNGFNYTANTAYNIVLSMGGVIDGFLVQARMPGDMPTNLTTQPMALLGSFTAGTNQQILTDCVDMGGTGDQATIAHQNGPLNVMSLSFDWTAPSGADGEVDFLYTVVREQTVHFDAISAAQIAVNDAVTTMPPPTTMNTGTTGPTVATPGITVPVRVPEDYRIQILNPEGCSRPTCDLFIGIDTNEEDPSMLDIYMEGTAQGWIAVGFSLTPNMFLADVVACNRVGDDIVAIDGWTVAAPNRATQTDTIQNVALLNSSFDGGRISCIVTKSIQLADGQDLDLNQELYPIFARRVGDSNDLNSLDSHAAGGIAVRGVSAMTVNPAVDQAIIGGNDDAVTTMPPPTTMAPGIAVPERAPEDYRIQILNPEGCSRPTCDLFIGIDTNEEDPSMLDIYMEGTAQGWIAVGFSLTPNMFLADVVACNRVGDDIVAIDGWTVAGPNRATQTDTTQNVALLTSSFDGGRISCIVTKSIQLADGQDLDLNQELYPIFARRVGDSNDLNSLDSHAAGGIAVRGVSAMTVNPAVDQQVMIGGNEFDLVHRPNLIRAHGILMIIAWPLLGITAIFFALFMRPALPNGEWFQVHRALLLASLFIGAAAFVLIFVALATSGGLVDTSSPISLTHLIFGVIIMALQIVNPIIAIFRCHPGTKNRWIFNLLHGSVVGFLAEILALINVALGLFIFSRGLARAGLFGAPLWLFVSWDVFYVVLVLVLFVLFTIVAIYFKKKGLAPSAIQSVLPADKETEKSEPAGINLDSAVGDKDPEKSAPKRKSPSKDAPLRWIALAVYLAITVPALVAVIVMVALPQ